ncbi:S8 family peptidase [Roseateles sp. PN1]|uniref:S8 family peptidase n=1 Tax=Roseateles sp. PN1 TaxID=3137372 RepID=UPI0031396A54
MTPYFLPNRIGFFRTPAAWAASALSLTLLGCGGGAEEAQAPASANAVAAAEASVLVEGRVFKLWAPGEEATVLAEQRQADPQADGSEVRLIVRLNPAAVMDSGRAYMLSATAAGDGGEGAEGSASDAEATAGALHAKQLAAKASAVATAVDAVVTQSVLAVSPRAQVRQQFSHAVESFVITVPWAQAHEVATELARNPSVDAVEPDRVFSTGQVAGVRTLDARAWGVDRIDQRARLFDNSFRQSLRGDGVNAYVLDTGINPHNEFGARLVAGFSAINDGRGTGDCNGHGTHVAGTVGGATLGVAPGARLVPVRVMDCGGSSTGSSVLAGLDWVAANGKRPGVVNMSLGGGASTTLDAAVQRLVTAGFSVVAAAGNSNVDACTQSPARAAGLITVAASDKADVKASFSNWGQCVAIWAPGTAISSAGHASTSAVVAMNGTSMAAPHAAGAVALLLQASPQMAPAQVRAQLLAQASLNAITGASASTTRSLLFAGQGAAVTPTPAPAPSPAPTPAPAPAPTVKPVLLQSITLTSSVPSTGNWKADAAVKVVNQAGAPVSGAKVLARFSNMAAEVSCTTAANGLCSIASGAAPWANLPVLGFAVTGISGPQLSYTGGVKSAQIVRPAAPVALLTALSGTMARKTPTAAEWVPQFLATLKDARGAAVSGATVQALLQVHVGARVVGLQTLSCLTNAAGQCTLAWTGPILNAAHTGASLQVLGVQRVYLTYQPGAISSAVVGRTK